MGGGGDEFFDGAEGVVGLCVDGGDCGGGGHGFAIF